MDDKPVTGLFTVEAFFDITYHKLLQVFKIFVSNDHLPSLVYFFHLNESDSHCLVNPPFHIFCRVREV